jgi:hypothetical protein
MEGEVRGLDYIDSGAVALRGWLPDGGMGGWIFGDEKRK